MESTEMSRSTENVVCRRLARRMNEIMQLKSEQSTCHARLCAFNNIGKRY